MTARLSARAGLLIEDLAAEFFARDPAFASTLSIALLANPLLDAARARLAAAGLTSTQGVDDPFGAPVLAGLLDAVRADSSEHRLEPTPRDVRPVEQLLSEEYQRTSLSGGRQMYVARTGQRPLLVVSALGVPIRVWRNLIADREGPFKPIFVETRASDLFTGGMETDSGLSEYAGDLAEALKTTAFDRVDVLAWCNGGRIAIDLAHRASERIGSIALLATTMRCAAEPSPTSSAFEDNLENIFKHVRQNPKSADLMSRLLMQLFFSPDWGALGHDRNLLANTFLGRARKDFADDLARPMRSGRELLNYAVRTQGDEAYPLLDALRGLPHPVLLITGDRDGIIDNQTARHAVEQAPCSVSVELAGAGHYVQDLQYPYLRTILARFCADPERAYFGDLARVVRTSRVDRRDQLPEWRYDAGGTQRGRRVPLARLFQYAAETRPQADAISDGEVKLSFAELERGARKLAGWLVRRGLGSGTRVVVLSEKRAAMAVIAAGIWKANGVYVPLDAENPPARTRELLDRVQPSAVVAGKESLTRLCADGLLEHREAISFDAVLAGCFDSDLSLQRDLPEPLADETAPAYVLFTSGSTGVPKGVTISHRSLLDYFGNHNRDLRYEPSSRVLALSPFHFDVSLEDTILPLSLGAFVYQFRGLQVGPLLRKVLKRESISHLIAVSSLLSLLSGNGEEVKASNYPALRMIMTGAEVCDPRVIDLWVNRLPGARVINAYGPTETTIVCLTYTIEQPDPDRALAYPIGYPLRGVRARLTDGIGHAIEGPGQPGELWIGGSQVMLEYLGLPEATAAACPVLDGDRWYRTGDLCELDERGRFVYLQRLDDMVKISGKRIHLGEIRERVLSMPGVEQTAVGVMQVDRQSVIGLAIVGAEHTLSTAHVRASLSQTLPGYMVPGIIGITRSACLTANGKTDEKSLMQALQRMLKTQGLVDGVFDLSATNLTTESADGSVI